MTFFSIALLLLTASFAFGELSAARKKELEEKLSSTNAIDISNYSLEEKKWIEEWILNVAKRRTDLSEDAYDRQLLQVGHLPTIEKYGKLMLTGVVSAHVPDSFQPRLIKYYEPRLSIKEPAWITQSGDVTGWRTSTSAAASMLHLLSASSEPPSEVRVWARDLLAQINGLGGHDPKARKGLEEARGIVRQWWAENKEAIIEERFSDVKPGKIHSFILEEQPKSEPITPAESVIKRSEPRGESSSAPKAAQEVAEAQKESSNWYWVVPAVCVALLVGLVAAFRKKR